MRLKCQYCGKKIEGHSAVAGFCDSICQDDHRMVMQEMRDEAERNMIEYDLLAPSFNDMVRECKEA